MARAVSELEYSARVSSHLSSAQSFGLPTAGAIEATRGLSTGGTWVVHHTATSCGLGRVRLAMRCLTPKSPQLQD
jgi:hypothetical protein